MSVSEFQCPHCGAKASAKNIPAGALIRCPKCRETFRLGGEAPKSAPASAPKSTPSATPKSTPAAKPTPVEKPLPKAAALPPSSPKITRKAAEPVSAVKRRGDSDDRSDDEERDDRPRKLKKKKSSGGNAGIFIGIGVACILVIGLVGILVGIVMYGRSKDDTKAVATNNPPQTFPQFDPSPSGRAPGGPANAGAGGNNAPSNTRPRENRPTTPASNPNDSGGDPSIGPLTPASSGSVQDIYQYVLKSTALILNLMPNGISSGTGSVVDANERLILTNYHVVANTQQLVVFFPIYENGKPVAERDRYMGMLKEKTNSPQDLYIAELVATDTQRDLALIRVPKLPAGTETLPLAKGVVNIGQTVHSVGNPGGSGALWVYTQGAVRAVYRKKWKAGGGDLLLTLDSEVVETQSPTNPGDSGGPLVNDRGELVGVTQGGSSTGQLLSTFISLAEARDFIEREYQRKFGKSWSPIARAPLRLRGGGGADVTTLITALDHNDAKTRASAAKSLGEMGPDAKLAIRRLVKSLKDADELTSRVAAEALSKIGAPSRDDLPALIEALRDPKPEVRRYAATAVGQIGPEASSAAAPLADALSDIDERVRESVVRSLGSLGSNAKATAAPALAKALNDDVKEVRVAAAASLTNLLNPPGADDVPTLVTILKHKDPEASVFGARALTKLGKQAKAAVPDLLEAVKNPDPSARRGAIDTLSAVGPDAKIAVPVYLTALKDSGDSGVRQSALLALGQLGKDLEKEKDAIAAVLDAVKDGDLQVKKAALAAIGKLGAAVGAPGAKQVMPAIIEDLQNKDANVRDQALETVSGLGPLAKDAVGTLITVMEKQDVKLYVNNTKKIYLQDNDEAFLDKIAKAIGKVGQPAVRQLLGSLNTTNINIGLLIGSCRALGEIGPPAKTAIATLQVISQSNLPPPVCFEADRALRKIATK